MLFMFATILPAQNDQLTISPYSKPATNAPVVVSADQEGHGKVWNVSGRPRVVSEFRLEPHRGDWPYEAYTGIPSPDGRRAAIIDPDSIRFRVVQLHPFRVLWRSGVRRDQLTQMVWSEDGRFLIVPNAGPKRLSIVYRATDPRPQGTIPISYPLFAQGKRIYGLSGTFGRPTGIAAIDLRTRRVIQRFVDPTVEGLPLGVSPDGRYLVSGGRNASGAQFRFRVWRAANGVKVAEFPGEGRSQVHVFDPVFLPGERFALLRAGEIRRLDDGHLVRRIPPLEDEGWVWVRTPGQPLRPRLISF